MSAEPTIPAPREPYDDGEPVPAVIAAQSPYAIHGESPAVIPAEAARPEKDPEIDAAESSTLSQVNDSVRYDALLRFIFGPRHQ